MCVMGGCQLISCVICMQMLHNELDRIISMLDTAVTSGMMLSP